MEPERERELARKRTKIWQGTGRAGRAAHAPSVGVAVCIPHGQAIDVLQLACAGGRAGGICTSTHVSMLDIASSCSLRLTAGHLLCPP